MALLTAEHVDVAYRPQRGLRVHAVRDVSLSIEQGEFVGLVGESGCGKSTLGHALTRLLQPPAQLEGGVIAFDGVDVSGLKGEELRRQRRGGFAIVPQSGMNSLNPVRTVGKHIHDVLRAHRRDGEDLSKDAIRRRGAELMQRVRLDPGVLDQFPHELSGGMRQRVAIALALALEPRLIVFDEPTTALDVIVQNSVMDTIKELQRDTQFSAVLISHDLGIVLDATDRVMVMYGGRIVEDQPSRDLAAGTHHPYTEALLRCYADPRADNVEIGGIPGSPPDLSQHIVGCSFAPRCPLAEAICLEVEPDLAPLGAGHAACHVRAPGATTARPDTARPVTTEEPSHA